MVVQLEFVRASATGLPMCESNVLTRWPRAVVDRALELRCAGLSFDAISKTLGVPIPTVFDWVSGRRRRPPDRVIVKRVKQRDSFGVNHQRAVPDNVDQPEKQGPADDPATASAGPLPSSIPSPANRRGEP